MAARDKRPLLSYLKVQEHHEREVFKLLHRSSSRIDATLRELERKQGIGAAIRRDQLRYAQVKMKREISGLWGLMGSSVEAAKANAAAEAAEMLITNYDAMLLRAVGAGDVSKMIASARATAARGLDVAESRLLGLSRIPLSARVWKSEQLVNGQLDRIIDTALARGLSARELAKEVRSFVRPDTPGGVRYAAQRLSRTELNNAFHATQVRETAKKPWVTGVEWHLSGSHPKPDECNEFADLSPWKPEEVPAKPHPNCLCYTTPANVDRDTFISQYESGAYDDYLDAEFPDLSKRASLTIKKATTTTTAAKKATSTPVPTPKPKPKPAPAPTGPKLPLLPSPESLRSSAAAVNPRYDPRKVAYSENCQSATTAFELRRRGFDVTATEAGEAGNHYLTWWEGLKTRAADAKIYSTEVRTALRNEILTMPDKARGLVHVGWNDGGSHVFSFVRDGDKIYFIDPQTGQHGSALAKYWADVKVGRVLRLDDLKPTNAITEGVKKR